LGHGNLAKRALEPTVILEQNETVRLVSEILESNGSSSMATVCGGSLALCSADVKVAKLTSGIAMGVVVKNSDEYVILTDIMGAEDHYGDMDLKVAGTKDGITAMQLDIKLDGLDLDILNRALIQATKGLEHILDIMEDAKDKIVPSGALPSLITFEVDSSTIPVIIGKGGSTIRDIIEKFSVNIDLNRDLGLVKISGDNLENLEKAKEYILDLVAKESKPVSKYEIGKVYKGVIKKSVDFGFFVEMPDGYDALLHNSKVPSSLLGTLSEGDEVEVKVISQKDKRVELSII
jgi:polyribonucleotide nucleotidyltransferase